MGCKYIYIYILFSSLRNEIITIVITNDCSISIRFIDCTFNKSGPFSSTGRSIISGNCIAAVANCIR